MSVETIYIQVPRPPPRGGIWGLNMRYDEINKSVAYDWFENDRNLPTPGGNINEVCNKTLNIIKYISKKFVPNDCYNYPFEYINLINYVNTLMSNPDIDSIESDKKRLELNNQLKDTQLKEQHDKLIELTQKLKEQDDKLIELTQKLNEKDFKLKKLEKFEDEISELEEFDAYYSTPKAYLGLLGLTSKSSNRFKNLELQLKEKDNKLKELEDQIKDLEDDLIYFTSSKKTDDIIRNLELSNQLKDTQLKEFTKKLEEKEEKIWAEELQHRLQEAGEEEALKAHQLRADKQQAARFEDELDFQNFIFNSRGERSAAKKKLKSKSKK